MMKKLDAFLPSERKSCEAAHTRLYVKDRLRSSKACNKLFHDDLEEVELESMHRRYEKTRYEDFSETLNQARVKYEKSI